MTIFCPQCGAKNETGAKFCSKCGAATEKRMARVIFRGGKTTTFAGIAAIAALALAAGAYFLFFNKTPEQSSAERKVDALLKTKDYKMAALIVDDFLKQQPENPASRALNIKVLASSGKWSDALEQYERFFILTGKDSPTSLLDILRGELGYEDSRNKLHIIGILTNIGTKEVIPDLQNSLKDTDPKVRSAAVRALGHIGAKEAIPDLRIALKDTDLKVRFRAAGFLGDIGAKEAIPDLRVAMNDADVAVRIHAIYAFGKIGAKETVPDLRVALKDSNGSIRKNAAMALAQMNAKEASADIVPLLEDKEKSVWLHAAMGLWMLGDKLGTDPRSLLKSSDSDARKYAIGVIFDLKMKESEAEIIRLLKDTDKDVRGAAIKALGSLGSKESVPYLRALLKDAEQETAIRAEAAEALGNLGESAKEAVADLVEASLKKKDDEMHERNEAMFALAKIGDRQVLPALRRVMMDKESRTRLVAAAAIWRLTK